jgi:putative ABC transport system permease protein
VLGLGLAAFLTPSLVGLASAQLPRTNTIGIDWSVFLFAIALAMTVGALCSAWPSWSLGRRDLSAAVREGGATGVSRSGTRVGNLLVVTEVALAATLAIASLLLVKDLSRLRGRNAGIVAEGVMTVSIDASGPLYPGRVERVGFYKQLAERLARAPEIRSFGLTSHLPMLDWGWNSEFNVDRKNPWPADKAPLVEHRWTHGDYFKTLGIPLLRGRWLDEREAGTPGTDRGPLTVLVNQAMAEKFWPGEDPIGRKFGQGTDTTQWYEVVGVVGNIRTAGLARAPLFEFFRTIDQDFQGTMTLVLKTRSSDPGDAIPVVRGIVTSIDPSLPLSRVQLLEDAMAASVGQQRLVSTLTSLFGGLAALLAAAGVFSVMTFSVRRQLREFAIRISFGARAADVRGLVLMRTGRLLAMGLTGGALFAWAGAALLQRNLLEVSPTDPATIAQGLIVVGVLTLIATLVPARAAAAASPLSLIRNNE